ncbi:MAG: hypothetical protein MSA65_03660 [Mollicutes bacterium]|nr:hypothetical protein [Mollicutes bacterium]
MKNKVSFANLKLKVQDISHEVQFSNDNGQTIAFSIIDYLPIQDKLDLVNIAIAKSRDGYNNINRYLAKELMNLYIVIMYTNISFTEKQKENEYKLYDILKSNQVIETVIKAMPQQEYLELQTLLEMLIEDEKNMNKSIAGAINNLLENLPKSAEAAQDIINSFDQEKYGQVLDLAKSVGYNPLLEQINKNNDGQK